MAYFETFSIKQPNSLLRMSNVAVHTKLNFSNWHTRNYSSKALFALWKTVVLWIMEKCAECKWERNRVYFRPRKQQRKSYKTEKHPRLGANLKVSGSVGGVGVERTLFHFSVLTPESECEPEYRAKASNNRILELKNEIKKYALYSMHSATTIDSHLFFFPKTLQRVL